METEVDEKQEPKKPPPALTIRLKQSDLLALYTTDTSIDGPHTRSVYITRESPSSVVMVENLDFHLYVAIPESLDIDTFMEEMTLAYADSFYGRLCTLNKTIQTKEDEFSSQKKTNSSPLKEVAFMKSGLLTLRNYMELQKEYKELLYEEREVEHRYEKEGDRIKGIKEEMGTEGFFIIKDFKQFHVPKYAAIMKYLEGTTQWKFTFDSHEVLQYFLQKFAKPFGMCRVWSDEERKYVPTVVHTIKILEGDGDTSFYIPSSTDGINHRDYILKQTKLFLESGHFYQWAFREFKCATIGRIDPAFPPKSGCDDVVITVVGDDVDPWAPLYNQNIPTKDHISLCMVSLRISDFSTVKLVDIKKKLHQLTTDRRKGGANSGGKGTKKGKTVTEEVAKKSRSAVKKQVYGGMKPLSQQKITF